MGLGKLRQDRYWVVADGKDSNTITREIGQGVLQLDELRLTERSPRSTAMKEHDRTSPSAGLVQINRLTVLIRQRYVREKFSNCRSDVGEINGGRHTSSFV
jgi:hypothetical protein